MANAAQPNRWEMTQKERETFERASLKTYSNVKERSIPQKSNFSWDMSTEEKDAFDRTLGKFRTKNRAEGVQLATSTQRLRSSILTDLQSDRYAGQEERLKLQEDIYSYDNMLRQMSLYGYDVSDARNSVAAIQDVANSRGKFFRQFKNEDEYIISVPEVRMKKYAENKQRIEEGQGSDEELEELTAWNHRYERFYKVLDDYGVYTQNADFDTVSRNRNFANPTRQDYEDYHRRMDSRNYTIDDQGDMWYSGEKIDDAFFEKYQEPVTADKLGVYLSASEDDINDAMNAFSEGNVSGYDKLLHDGEGAHWELLSEDEVDIYYYLMNTQGKNAAYQYLDDMQVTLDRRYTINDEKSHEDDSVPERILYSIASVPESILGGIGAFLSDAAAYVDGEEINPYDGAHYMLNSAAAIRETTADAIDNATGGASFLGISLGDVYQAGMSGADSFAGAYLLGGTGYGAVMGMGAASSEARKLYEAGASREQIAEGALLTGAAEMVFEKISIEHFVHLGNAKNIAAVITNTLKQGGIEASEEIATELANTITNKIVMGSQSDFDQGVKKLMEQEGLTYAQAAAMYVGHNAWKAGAGGFISGSMLGGTRSAVSYAGTQLDIAREGKRILNDGGYDKLRTIAEELAEKTAGKEAAKLGEYIVKADAKTTARNVGRVSNQFDTARQEQNRLYVRNILIENGMDERQANKTTESFLRAFETERLEKLISEGSADKLLNNSAVLAVLDKVASLEEKSVNTRNQKHQLAMLGIKVNQDGAVDRKSLADAMFTAALFSPQTSITAGSQQTDSHDATAYHDNALIYTALISLGVHKAAAESLAKSYDPADGISPEIYARGAAEAFFYGKGNFTETALRNGNGLSPVLTELQRSTAYRLGQIMNDSQGGKTAFGVEQNEYAARLDPKLVSAVDALAKLFHIKVRFGDLGGNNGLYHPDTGLIELDIAPQHRGASNAFLFSVSHELGHAVKARIGSEAWNAFAEYAVKAKGGEGAVKAKQESTAEYSEYSVAREEVVCDFIGELLSEQTALDNLCASIKNGAVKLETARGIVAAWHKLLNIFKGKTAQQTDLETAALVKRVQEQFGADIETAENAVKKLQQALSTALQTEKNTAGGSVESNAVSFSKKENGINPESTEAERYAILSRVQLSPANVNYENLSNVNLDDYNTRRKSDVEKGIKRLADVLGVSGVDLQNSYIDFPFQYSKASILKSLHHQLEYGGSYQDYVKAMSCFNELIANAVPIETHLDKKVGTQRENPDLKQVYVLISAFRDGNSVVPVQFEIKEFYSAKSGLYLTVTLTKIDTGVLEETPADITAGDTSPLLPMSAYSLRSIFENVNPADGRFLKYVPDGFLNKAQLEAKHEALRKQTAEYASYAVKTPEKSRTAATKKSIKDKQQDMDNAEGDLKLTKVGSTDIDDVTEGSQNTPKERTALSDHGTQNDLSHEQRPAQEQPTVHSLLMETDASKVKNTIERKYLKEYQQTANRQLAEQQKLDKLQAELDALPKEKRQTSRARFLRDEIIKTKNRLQICQSIQTRLETDSPLTYLINRKTKSRLAEAQKIAMQQMQMTINKGEQVDSRSQEMEEFYKVWSKSIGINDAVKTLAEYYNVKYNDYARYELLESYVYSVVNGRMSPMAHFDLYEEYHRRIQEEIVGKKVNGIQISGQTKHFLERVFGTMYDPKTELTRSGVSIEEIRDCIANPVNILPVKTDVNGRRSFVVVGHTAKVSINVDTGLLIQTNPWRE